MKNLYKIAVLANNTPVDALVYSCESPLKKGQLVEVPFANLQTVGLVLGKQTAAINFKTKPVTKVFDKFLPQDLHKTLVWMKDYYVSNLAHCLNLAIIDNSPFGQNATIDPSLKEDIALNAEQKQAIKILQTNDDPAILHGITGSGKTHVYAQLIKEAGASGKSSIILTPEIGLTAQVEKTLKRFVDNVVVFHSGLTKTQRKKVWNLCLDSNDPLVVVGARSSLFLPCKNLGLVIIDEAHDQSYKQGKTPKYNAVDVATIRCQAANAKLILGTATPDVARYWRSKKLNRQIVELTKPAIEKSNAKTLVVDMTKSKNKTNKNWLSKPLKEAIEENLQKQKQTLLFHNRRGNASVLLCNNCGWSAVCPRCSCPLTLHVDVQKAICHICNLQQKIPVNCPDCSHHDIITKGVGTKQIAADLSTLFGQAKIMRFDTDNKKSESLNANYAEVASGEIDIIVGTQMISKGLDLPNLHTVGVISAEVGAGLPDFATTERLFQQIQQVRGRVGRHSSDNSIIIQTYNPDSNFMNMIKNSSWSDFYNSETNQRQQFNYPPFKHLLSLKNSYKKQASAQQSASKLADHIKQSYPSVEVLGPAPAFLEKTSNNYHWQIVVKSADRSHLTSIASNLPSTGNWHFDLDPISLL